jgi:hypothetical protein
MWVFWPKTTFWLKWTLTPIRHIHNPSLKQTYSLQLGYIQIPAPQASPHISKFSEWLVVPLAQNLPLSLPSELILLNNGQHRIHTLDFQSECCYCTLMFW